MRTKAQLDGKRGITNQGIALRQASGEAFYNTSPFCLRDLRSRARQQQLRADFEAYLNGFSPNVQEILERFRFRNEIPTLVDNDILGFLIEKFLDSSVNLSPRPVLNADGSVRLPGLDNHSMGTVFEELIRRFSEENNEEAGEHFTPRDVVELMAHLIFEPIADQVQSTTYLVYDGACGTGGMLTVAEETLARLARDQGKRVSIHLFGQEVNHRALRHQQGRPHFEGRGRRGGKYSIRLHAFRRRFPRSLSSILCFRTRLTARVGRATWSAWAARPVSPIPALWLRMTAPPNSRLSPARATGRCSFWRTW